MDNKISVILITYNRVDFLKRNIPKIISLLKSGDELLVINNNSTDNTEEFLNSLKHVNFRSVLINEQGLNICRNAAIIEAKHRYLLFIDDDAYPDKEWLECFRKALMGNKNACIYCGKTINDYEIEEPKYLANKFDYLFGAKDYGEGEFYLKKGQSPGGGNMIIDKEIIKKLGGFDNNFDRRGKLLISNGETELVSKIFKNNFKIYYVPGAKIYHWAGKERTNKKWLIKRMYWQGISDGLLARKNGKILFLILKRILFHLIYFPAFFIINIFVNKNKAIFSLILEFNKTGGIIKSTTMEYGKF